MKNLLLATVALVALSAQPAAAAIIADLGVNPRSAQGDFANSVGGATFEDQYTFQLVGEAQFVSIASATNVYTSTASGDFISNFTGQLYQVVGTIDPNGPGGDDIGYGAISATACDDAPLNCQILAGVRLLEAGNYYLEISGTGGGSAGYGGNLTTVGVVPIPGMALAVPFGALGFGWVARRRRKLAGQAVHPMAA